MTRALVLVVCGLLASPAPSSAEGQGPVGSIAGATVAPAPYVGPLVRSAQRQAIWLAGQADPKPPGEAKPSPKPSGNWFMRRPVRNGALIGAGAGLAAGIVAVAAASATCEPPSTCSTAGVAIVAYPLLLAPVGALVGQVIAWSR